MKIFLSNHADKCYAIMRLIVGLLFACHGAQKLFGVLGGQSEIHEPEGLVAGVVEFVGGLLIAVGVFARVAAFIASGEMAVAYFKAHASRSFWPILNHGELAILYCFAFLYIGFQGAGSWSLHSLVRTHRDKT
jgi:putative oxidoreductase